MVPWFLTTWRGGHGSWGGGGSCHETISKISEKINENTFFSLDKVMQIAKNVGFS